MPEGTGNDGSLEELEADDSLEAKSIRLLNDVIYLRHDNLTISMIPADIVANLYKERKFDWDSKDDPRLTSAAPRELFYTLSKDGNSLIIVPQGYGATVQLDNTTAIVTDGLYECYGYGLHLRGNNQDFFSVIHNTVRDNGGSLAEHVRNIPPSQALLEAVYSIPYPQQAAQSRILEIRGLLNSKNPNVSEPFPPDTHSYMTGSAVLVTNKGGVILRNSDRNFHAHSSWKWGK